MYKYAFKVHFMLANLICIQLSQTCMDIFVFFFAQKNFKQKH